MNKTVLKIFISFSLIASVTAILLLCINLLGAAILATDSPTHIYSYSPRKMLEEIGNSLYRENGVYSIAEDISIDENCWCILLDESGDVVWSQNRPNDIPSHYSINDVARLTRWYLNDYPVYVRTIDYGLLILGKPKYSVGKYDIEYSMEWFDTLPQRILTVFAVNLILALLLALLFGANIYKNLKELIISIKELRNEREINLKERGIFKEVAGNLNITSAVLAKKNRIIAARDRARANWVAGISHDIRTPLAIIMGNAESLENSEEISENNRKKSAVIAMQSKKIKKLIDDLNLISSLEYDMQPSKKQILRISRIIREVAADICNSIDDKYEINVKIMQEDAQILGDGALLERAVYNLVNNSIVHNCNGCIIDITEYTAEKQVLIEIADNGTGIDDEIIKNIDNIPMSKHGLGLPMTKKIVEAHGGILDIKNENGCKIIIILPKE